MAALRGAAAARVAAAPAHAHCGDGSPAARALCRAEGDGLRGARSGGVLRDRRACAITARY